jgi:hypothetical protein
MKLVFLLISMVLIFVCGCGEGNSVTIRTENRLNISKINLGMSKAEVLQIMGDKSARASFGKNAVTVTNPFRSEIRQENDKTYEILYYYTHQDQRDWPTKRFKILERELTPIIFYDGKVIGWGQDFLQNLPNFKTM